MSRNDTWKSSLMQHEHCGGRTCPVCMYIAGERDTWILDRVIHVLDYALSIAEKGGKYDSSENQFLAGTSC